MFGAPLQGKRKRGKQKTRWEDVCNRGMDSVVLKKEDVLYRTTWTNDMHNHSGDPM